MYLHFRDAQGNEFGSFEVFRVPTKIASMDKGLNGPGWYWMACFPGCLPDSDPVGPFDTKEDAIRDAQDF